MAHREKKNPGLEIEDDPLPKFEEGRKELDRHFVKETNESMDTMMIFAGLFSAAITQFISSTSLGLTADPNDLTNQLLNASIFLQMHPNTPISDFPKPDAFEPSSLIITINAMLFFSLMLSLLSALGAMVVKQWIRQYETYGVAESLLWKRMRRRTEKQTTMEDLHLKQVIAYIPYTLHLALAIFLSAVLVWIFTLNPRTMIPSAILVGLAALAYTSIGVASLIPGATEPFRDGDEDVEKGEEPVGSDAAPSATVMPASTFILNPPHDMKPRVDQRRPPVAKTADAKFWIDVIRGTEKHDDLLHAFYELRTANWGQLKLDGLLVRNGEEILGRCSDVAKVLWEPFGQYYYVKQGSEERARAICLFIEWFYHQLSKDQRRSLKEWPDSNIAKALMYDPLLGQTAPPGVSVVLPSLEDVTLANSVIAKLHHVRLSKEAVCDMCFVTWIRGEKDVRVMLARAEDPQEYEADAPKRDHYPFERRMQSLVSACVSSDVDCLLHYTSGLDEEELKKRIVVSNGILAGCVVGYTMKLPHHLSYVKLREMLEFLQNTLGPSDLRLEWLKRVYSYADRRWPDSESDVSDDSET